jgi:hypothetical protein
MSLWALHCQTLYQELQAQKVDIEQRLDAINKKVEALHTQKQVLKGQAMIVKQLAASGLDGIASIARPVV